ncbi:class I SAM-dependent methyltransferase [Paeniglutamicibacter antarcticus]|uniref:Class I SAM-dependent methyltransferase n=2 Tax=Paeniglutamicibacter antarcticus TaxID=494023 RepID=A0ABP9TJ50_9MICC
MAELLDLDALLLEAHFRNIFDWTKSQSTDLRTIVDLGAGTGTGTFGLARMFPSATVAAVDQSESMLELLREKAERRQLSRRVSTIRADLDEQWPELGEVDLMWAATSMHHFNHPAEIFAKIRNSLSPGGVLVIVEMEELPRYLPVDLGFGTPGFEERCHLATDRQGFNPHPDWTAELDTAGYTAVTHHKFGYCQSNDQKLLARAAKLSLARLREHLADGLPTEDTSTLDQLLDPDSGRALEHRNDLVMRGSHNVWAARPR